MKKCLIVAVIVILCVSLVDAAPTRQNDEQGFRDWLGGRQKQVSFQLFDPSRLTINHSVSFGGSFGNDASLMQSIYMTRIGYQLSDPLTMTLLLGLQNSQIGGSAPDMSLTSPIGGFMLDYKPMKNMYFHLSIIRAPQQYRFGSYDLYSPYQSPAIE